MSKQAVLKQVIFISFALVATFSSREALASCSEYTYVLHNGSTANADEVMDDFEHIRSCANLLAPLNAPAFTGSASFSGATSLASATFSSTVTFSSNVGIGVSPINKLTIADGGAPWTGGTNRFLQLYTNSTGQVEIGLGNTNNLFALRATLGTGGANQRIGFVDGGGVERLIVTGGGNVGIGTTSPTYPLDVVGDMRTSTCLRYNGGSAGTCPSDLVLKRDIEPFTLGLAAVVGLRPVNFYYNGLGGVQDDGVRQLGLIAQEVERVAPQLIGARSLKLHPSDPNPIVAKTVDYGALTYMLINAVKELKATNDRYALELATLRGEVAALQRRDGIRTARLEKHSTR